MATAWSSARPKELTVFRATPAAYAPRATVGLLSDLNRMERVPNAFNESQRPVDGTCQTIGDGSLQRVFNSQSTQSTQSND
jgi:hypothetical protein